MCQHFQLHTKERWSDIEEDTCHSLCFTHQCTHTHMHVLHAKERVTIKSHRMEEDILQMIPLI